jgi:hypothetical protein
MPPRQSPVPALWLQLVHRILLPIMIPVGELLNKLKMERLIQDVKTAFDNPGRTTPPPRLSSASSEDEGDFPDNFRQMHTFQQAFQEHMSNVHHESFVSSDNLRPMANSFQ